MTPPKRYIEIGYLKKLAKKLAVRLVGQVYHQERYKLYERECLMRQMYQYQQEMTITENSIVIFMDCKIRERQNEY